MYNIKKSNKGITNNEELAETFNTFFDNILSNVNIGNNLGDNITNPNVNVFCAMKTYENYPLILKIKETMGRKIYHFPLNSLIE